MKRRATALLAIVFTIATAGLVYELVAGALASYLMGDSVTEFSLVIGVYLSALGAGAYASRWFQGDVARAFVDVELATAVVGGCSALLLLFCHARGGQFHLVLFGTVFTTGTLVGLELPLLLRLLKEELAFEELVAKALFFDYLGAVVASVLFAMVLVPRLGLPRTSLLFGALNAGVGLLTTFVLPAPSMRGARVRAGLVLAGLVALYVAAPRLSLLAESAIYEHPIVLAEQSPYQRIVLTKTPKGNVSLFLNANLQLSTADEARYHEALVHPAFAVAAAKTSALVLGGGDGLAVREILKHPSVREVVLVDLDPVMTHTARTHPVLSAQNRRALDDPRVTVVHEDAAIWVRRGESRFDVIVADFPDPNGLPLGKLYTVQLYRELARRLADGGALSVQSTSPFYSPETFWSIAATLRAAGFSVRPYHAFVPAFGEWGYCLAKRAPFDAPTRLPDVPLAALDAGFLPDAFHFPADMAPREGEVSTLVTQGLVRTYEREIARFTM